MRFSGRAATSLVIVLAFLLSGPPAAGRGKKPEKAEKRTKPRVLLRVDPSVGFTPVTAVLTGELRGVAIEDSNFCHAAITWVRIDPGHSEQSASHITQDPVCRHSEEEIRVRTHFTKTFTLSRPGTYLFRLEIQGKSGKRLRSEMAQVRVLRVQ